MDLITPNGKFMWGREDLGNIVKKLLSEMIKIHK